ncbi:MAG: Gfo/Idh/MocA family protein [Pyrinomonadaceae bacterium]
MKDRVGIGIIGTGFARNVQIPAFVSCDGARIVSIASGTLENARSAADHFGVEHYTDDWRETVRHDEVDLVCITTPPKLHREMTLFALEQEKHILCEKPMAMNVAEALGMAAAADSVNVFGVDRS